jgi:ABC-type amino acid transport substrate-binding protein
MIQLRKFSLFVLFLVLGLSPPTYATTPYIVGIYENPPLAFTENNEPKGFLVELLEYVAREEGWELTFIKCDWSECLDNLEKGFIDFLLPLAFSPQRAERFDFGKTNLLINWGELYCRKNVTLNSITDLEGKTIAIVPKGIYAEAFQNMISNLGISNVNYVMANDHEEVFRLISDHRVEAGVASRFAGFAFLDRYPEVGRKNRNSQKRFKFYLL